MTLASYEVREFRGHKDSRPVVLRNLATRFRRGETLDTTELHILRDFAADNGNALLLERIRIELRTQ